MRASFPLWEGLHCHATSDGRFVVTLTKQMDVTIPSHQSTFCDIISEQERNKIQIKYPESDGKTISDDTWGLVWLQIVIDHRARYIPRPGSGTRRPRLTLFGTRQPRLIMLGDSSTIPHAVLRDCFDHSPTTARCLISSATCEIGLMYSWAIITF
jgi:hypothetical protein